MFPYLFSSFFNYTAHKNENLQKFKMFIIMVNRDVTIYSIQVSLHNIYYQTHCLYKNITRCSLIHKDICLLTK